MPTFGCCNQSAENRALRFIVSLGASQVERGRDLLRRAGRSGCTLARRRRTEDRRTEFPDGNGRARPAAEVPAEQTAESLDAAPAAAVPTQAHYQGTQDAYQTRTQLRHADLLQWALQQLLDQR